MIPRRAGAADAPALSRIMLDARSAAGDRFPPPVHRDDELLPHLLRDVLPRDEVWLAEHGGAPAGLLVLERSQPDPDRLPRTGPDLLTQLFTAPEAQGRGIGGGLLAHALRLRPGGLDLWVYAGNTPARSFYARRGFTVVGGTSAGNEEGVPDLLMRAGPR